MRVGSTGMLFHSGILFPLGHLGMPFHYSFSSTVCILFLDVYFFSALISSVSLRFPPLILLVNVSHPNLVLLIGQFPIFTTGTTLLLVFPCYTETV